MNILIQHGHVVDPASGFSQRADVAVQKGHVLAIGNIPADFEADQTIDAADCMVIPGLVDACARLGEPGHEHEGMLESELAAAVAGGVTSVVCPPDTQPVLDEPGWVAGHATLFCIINHSFEHHLRPAFPSGFVGEGQFVENLQLTSVIGLMEKVEGEKFENSLTSI